jgi:hypothetical protein
MLIKKILKILLILFFSLPFSCRLPDHLGFYQPITLPTTIPDGPPEFKAGWHAGCRTGLMSNKAFANSFVADLDYGSGVYQHDPVYQTAFSNAFFTCYVHGWSFTETDLMDRAPLQK